MIAHGPLFPATIHNAIIHMQHQLDQPLSIATPRHSTAKRPAAVHCSAVPTGVLFGRLLVGRLVCSSGMLFFLLACLPLAA